MTKLIPVPSYSLLTLHHLDTDLLQAQSDPYRRMSANLYQTKQPGEYYHIHGSLDASTTLGMIGLEPFRPDLKNHEAIVDVIESHVQNYTVEELEALNAYHQQAGVPAYKHNDFLLTPHVRLSFLAAATRGGVANTCA